MSPTTLLYGTGSANAINQHIEAVCGSIKRIYKFR
jgi:hypothetical protein